MTDTSKTAVLSGVAICAVLATLVVVFVRGAMSQRAVKSVEGYFSPIYSPDGQYVYFLERSTSGTVEQTSAPDIFSPPVRRPGGEGQVHPQEYACRERSIEEFRRLPPSPIERRYERSAILSMSPPSGG